MSKLIVNDNYLLQIANYSCPKKIRKFISKHYKFIKRKDSKLLFTDGETIITLWRDKFGSTLWGNNSNDVLYGCAITLENNNTYRTTKYSLNSNSCYVCIRIHPICLTYLRSHACVRTLAKFLFVIDIYKKLNNKKKVNKFSAITKVFQDDYVVRNISEFL
jgi:hypothetical protein